MLQCTIPPLNQRIFCSDHTRSGPLQLDTSQRPSKLKQWSAEAIDKAINAVLNEGMSIKRAYEHYTIPKSALRDRISGRVLQGSYKTSCER